MQTITEQLAAAFQSAIRDAFDLEADPLVSVSQNSKFGDYQSNAAMPLAGQLSRRAGQKISSRQVAEQIIDSLQLGEMAAETSIAGPGFINVRLAPAWLARQLNVIASHSHLGIEPAGDRQRVVVDYSGPNIAKEMHV